MGDFAPAAAAALAAPLPQLPSRQGYVLHPGHSRTGAEVEPYSPWDWNCETFATYAMTSYRRSIQARAAAPAPPPRAAAGFQRPASKPPCPRRRHDASAAASQREATYADPLDAVAAIVASGGLTAGGLSRRRLAAAPQLKLHDDTSGRSVSGAAAVGAQKRLVRAEHISVKGTSQGTKAFSHGALSSPPPAPSQTDPVRQQ